MRDLRTTSVLCCLYKFEFWDGNSEQRNIVETSVFAFASSFKNRQQMIVFILNISIFKNGMAEIKGKRRRCALQELNDDGRLENDIYRWVIVIII